MAILYTAAGTEPMATYYGHALLWPYFILRQVRSQWLLTMAMLYYGHTLYCGRYGANGYLLWPCFTMAILYTAAGTEPMATYYGHALLWPYFILRQVRSQ